MPPTADEYRAGVLQLLQQQRGSLTSLIEQVDGALTYDWQRAMGAAASLYGPILDQYAKDLAALRAEADDPSARLTLDWLTSKNPQLATIQQSVMASAEKYGQTAARTITHAQSAATDMAASDAAQLTQRSLWPAVEGAGVPPSVLFNRTNPDAVAQWVGRAGNGHPLGDLFSGFGAEATQGARQAMMLGLLTGANPKAMASGIANALGISRSRATIISRTEVLGSYRSAAHETYRANSDVLDGWIWSAGGANPCAMCMGMDGLQFSLSEELVDHPCGKCAPIPITKSWGDILGPLGIDSSDMEETSMGAEGAYETGPEKFARMSPQQQRAIIGTKTGYEAYQRGEVELKDFIGTRPAEGGFPAMPYQKSLREMEIPTGRAGSPLVEQSPRLRELERAGQLRARDFGAKIEPDQMPAWARKSYASQAVYQIMRNGLPWNMAGQELPLLSVNIEQMLTEDLSLNVRMAALRLQDMLKQYDTYLERYVRNVTSGASTLGKAPEFVYKPSKELERALAAARAGERGTVETGLQPEVNPLSIKSIGELRAEGPNLATYPGKLYGEESFDIGRAANPNQLVNTYGEHQLAAALNQYSHASLREVADELGVKVGRTKAETISNIVSKVTEGRYNGVFTSVAEKTSAQAAEASEIIQSFGTVDDIVARETAQEALYEGVPIGDASTMEKENPEAAAIGGERMQKMITTLVSELKDNQSFLKLAREFDYSRDQVDGWMVLWDNAKRAVAAGDHLALEDPEQVALARMTNAEARAWAKERALNDAIYDMLDRYHSLPESVGEDVTVWSADPFQVAVLEAAKKEFGLTSLAHDYYGAEAIAEARASYGSVQSGIRALLRQMHADTQRYFEEQGITEMQLFRGVRWLEGNQPAEIAWGEGMTVNPLTSQPVASWASNAEVAYNYATGTGKEFVLERGDYGMVLVTRVPVGQIMSMPYTGFGSEPFREIMLLAGDYPVYAVPFTEADAPSIDAIYQLMAGQGPR